MTKTHKHILKFEQEYDFDMIGICCHHNDYRLAWSINEQMGIEFKKSDENYIVPLSKGNRSEHSLYEFKDPENLIEYYLIKNKNLGKYLIPELQAIDYFLFLFENHNQDPIELIRQIKSIPIILGVYNFDPMEYPSTKNIIFA